MTLHQGQGHQNEHEHYILYAMYRSAVMPSLNVIAQILFEDRDARVTLNEGHSHQNGNGHIDL